MATDDSDRTFVEKRKIFSEKKESQHNNRASIFMILIGRPAFVGLKIQHLTCQKKLAISAQLACEFARWGSWGGLRAKVYSKLPI